ncbi:metal-dependent transcriptional regulator [Desulfonauticus submarinus]
MNKKKKQLTPSLEDYLETIFHLENTYSSAQAKDIASNLGVKRASVTGALRTLAAKGLINYEPYSKITLTPEGFRQATRIVHRHKVLAEFLENFLCLNRKQAEENACRLEHHIDDLTLERLIDFIDFIQKCPRTGKSWIKALQNHCHKTGNCSVCKKCLQKALEEFEEKKSS